MVVSLLIVQNEVTEVIEESLMPDERIIALFRLGDAEMFQDILPALEEGETRFAGEMSLSTTEMKRQIRPARAHNMLTDLAGHYLRRVDKLYQQYPERGVVFARLQWC